MASQKEMAEAIEQRLCDGNYANQSWTASVVRGNMVIHPDTEERVIGVYLIRDENKDDIVRKVSDWHDKDSTIEDKRVERDSVQRAIGEANGLIQSGVYKGQ